MGSLKKSENGTQFLEHSILLHPRLICSPSNNSSFSAAHHRKNAKMLDLNGRSTKPCPRDVAAATKSPPISLFPLPHGISNPYKAMQRSNLSHSALYHRPDQWKMSWPCLANRLNGIVINGARHMETLFSSNISFFISEIGPGIEWTVTDSRVLSLDKK